MTIKQVLSAAYKKLQTKRISSALIDAEILLSFVIKKPREFILAHPEKTLTAAQIQHYQKLISRRSRYEPVAYLIGYKEFYGLKLKINRHVLIPRPETELLIEAVLEAVSELKMPVPTIIDIGAGSGAIALALKKSLPKAQIWALEASETALSLARQNAKNLDLNVNWLKSDLLARLPVKSLGGAILAVNLPYVAKSELANFTIEVRRGLSYEPSGAIFAAKDGTAVYEQLFRQIADSAAKPSCVIAEIGSFHYKRFLALAKQYFIPADIKLEKDLAGRPRLLIIKF